MRESDRREPTEVSVDVLPHPRGIERHERQQANDPGSAAPVGSSDPPACLSLDASRTRARDGTTRERDGAAGARRARSDPREGQRGR